MNQTNGKIIKINKLLYTVNTVNGVFLCSVRGKLKNDKLTVGDNVIIDMDTKTIEKLLPRKNTLIRPLVSNIDKLFVVVSTHIPEFSTLLIDEFITICENNNIEPIIIVSKLDLIKSKERKSILNILKYYKKIGYKAFKNTEIKKIKKEIKNSVVSLTGQTGSGKSTLLNKIDKSLKLQTGEVSISLGRGKHTTRIVELIPICNGLIADTPGFSSLEVNLSKEQIRDGFVEFGHDCKYNTCMHIKEQGCKVIEDVSNKKILRSRYDNYLKLINKQINNY